MKKIIASLVVAMMAAITVSAQQPDPMQQAHHRSFHHHVHGMMAKKLNFSDQQKQQLKSINSDYRKKLADLKKNEDITVREFKSRMSVLRKEHRTQIQALLTPEQKDQVAKMKQERMQLAKVNAGARAERMKIKLGLNDAQASQLKEIRTGMAAKIKAIHTDNSLSREQKHAQIKSLVMQQKDQLKTILTTEQLQQLQQMRAAHNRRDFSK